LPPYVIKWLDLAPGPLSEVERCDLFLLSGTPEAEELWTRYNPEKEFIDPLSYSIEQEVKGANE